MSVFGDYPGIPGCFIAAIFAAALRYDVIYMVVNVFTHLSMQARALVSISGCCAA